MSKPPNYTVNRLDECGRLIEQMTRDQAIETAVRECRLYPDTLAKLLDMRGINLPDGGRLEKDR